MNYGQIETAQINDLWELQLAYKNDIGEESPSANARERLSKAIEAGKIEFYGAWDESKLVGCCSITKGFSTFNYAAAGVFEDFYIIPKYRHRGIAGALVRFAFEKSGIESMTVGCADCDLEMYRALGFSVKFGNLLAFE